MKCLFLFLNFPRCLIAYLLCLLSKKKKIIFEDLKRWSNESKKRFLTFSYLLLYRKEYRNVVELRLRSKVHLSSAIFRLLFRRLDSLYLTTNNIGQGLYINHGFSTIIACESIGNNFTCFQQVTVGYNGDKKPIIENDVTIHAGAIVIGGVTLHSGCVVGAGAVVTKDVPENAVVAGVPAKVIENKNKGA